MDPSHSALTPSSDFFPHLVEKNACEQKQEGHCQTRFSKDLPANPVSAEPYMQESKGDGPRSQPPECHSRTSLMGSSFRKLSSLEETVASKISPTEPRGNGATLPQCRSKGQPIKGQLTGPASVNSTNLLASLPITAAEEEVRAVSPSLELDDTRWVSGDAVLGFDGHLLAKSGQSLACCLICGSSVDRIHRTRICNPPSQCSNMTVEHCTDSKSELPHVSWPALACVLEHW